MSSIFLCFGVGGWEEELRFKNAAAVSDEEKFENCLNIRQSTKKMPVWRHCCVRQLSYWYGL